MRHQGSRVCRPPWPGQPPSREWVEFTESKQRGGDGSEARLHLAVGFSLSSGLGEALLAPQGTGRGRHGRSAGVLLLPVGWWRGRGLGSGLGAPKSAAFVGQATIIQLPAPRQSGEAERLVAAAVKAKGFSLFPGIAGKCSLPKAGSSASGLGEGSGMPSAEEETILQDQAPGSPGLCRGGQGKWRLTSPLALTELPLCAGISSGTGPQN